ncbi:MAG TPA: hypothetical protein VFF16_10905 [Telluria sp.]|nr:hypothetical protein [Telluria sp.]
MNWKFALAATSCWVCSAAGAASLTELEIKWLQAGAPVLAYAQSLHLPIDIIVQPTPGADPVPLAMGFADGRCKLVLTLRANPDAEATLRGLPAARQALYIEAMTAHEIGHCWRYAHGVWHQLPAGFTESSTEQGSASLLAAARAIRQTRREEGYADLAALAWIRRAHPGDYAEVHRWLSAVRSEQPVPHGPHDTRVWVALAADATVFGDVAAPFDAARRPWDQGLLSNE